MKRSIYQRSSNNITSYGFCPSTQKTHVFARTDIMCVLRAHITFKAELFATYHATLTKPKHNPSFYSQFSRYLFWREDISSLEDTGQFGSRVSEKSFDTFDSVDDVNGVGFRSGIHGRMYDACMLTLCFAKFLNDIQWSKHAVIYYTYTLTKFSSVIRLRCWGTLHHFSATILFCCVPRESTPMPFHASRVDRTLIPIGNCSKLAQSASQPWRVRTVEQHEYHDCDAGYREWQKLWDYPKQLWFLG